MDQEVEAALHLGVSFEVLSVALEAAADEPLEIALACDSGRLAGRATLARLPDDGHSLLAAQLDADLAAADAEDGGGQQFRLSGRIDVYAQASESRVVLKCKLAGAQANEDQVKDMLGGYLVAAVNAARAAGKLIADDQPSIISRILFTGRAYWVGCSMLAAAMMALAVLSHF